MERRRPARPLRPSAPAAPGPGSGVPGALLFDLDGTLADPRVGFVRCVEHALAALGRPSPGSGVLARAIGPPLRRTFAALLGTEDAGLVERAVALYRERFGDTGLFECAVYPGVPAMLADAARAGAALFVATSKPAVYAERIVERVGLARHFRRVYGADLAGRLDDKRALLAHVLAAEGLAGPDAVMIGDRAVDVVAARANGVRAVGALWGFGTRVELADAGADALCGTPGELATCVARLTG